MPSEAVDIGATDIASRREEARLKFRTVIEGEHPSLLRQIGLFIYKQARNRTREEVEELAAESLGEAVRRVLENPGNYDPARSAFAWIMGVAMRIVDERARGSAVASRRVDLSAESWAAIKDRHCDEATTRRMDGIELSEILARLSESDREALVQDRILGLKGGALAEALGVATESAARARVYRAIQRARQLGRRDGEKVKS